MNTTKLFYEDSHLQSFAATVTDCAQGKGGWKVTLDATAFYPEGGGQASDTGVLGEAAVLSVWEEGEEIFHLCDKPLEIGSTVNGKVNWQRRFDLMQQHAGEHIVSGIIHKRYGWHNVGFHIGAELVTIDFDGPVPEEDLQVLARVLRCAVAGLAQEWLNKGMKEDPTPTLDRMERMFGDLVEQALANAAQPVQETE